jgi:RNA polymerase sigma factor (sigma-70 family)
LSDFASGGYSLGEMQPQSDASLLREYAEHGKESAFADLVARHTNLVYSAALRQVDSPDQAAEVAQQVFIGLARGAQTLSRKLAEDASLAGWVCRSARNLSLNLRRDEFRRHSRERQVMAQLDSAPETLPDWEKLRPSLDEAMAELSEADYDAIVLRYYQKQDLRSVGQALGLSDDAAQKRVSRAVDRLRESFAKRGVTISAAGLVALVSANAVQAAPAGLAAAFSAAALLAGVAATTTVAATATTATTAAKTFVMTTFQKAALVILATAAVGTGVYGIRHAALRRDPAPTPQPIQAPQAATVAPAAEPSPPAPAISGKLPPVVPVSLASLLVPAENDQWDKSAVFKTMPRGKQVLGSIEFQLEGLLQLQSSASRDENRGYRQSIVVPLAEPEVTAAGLEILQHGSNVAAAHLVGATRYGGEGESTVAQVVWRYVDGSRQTTHVRFQNHVRDWIRLPYETPAYLPYTFSKAVWRAPVPGQAGRWARLYRFSYANPEPKKVLKEIEFVSTMQTPNLFLVGLTLDSVRLGERLDDSPNLEPTDPAPPEGMEVTVQTTDGAPIPNAQVQVQVEQVSGKSPSRLDHSQSTDPKGIAHMNHPPAQDIERLEVSASHPEFGGRKMSWERRAGDSIPASFTFKLGNSITIGGRVVDESDMPIAGAKLTFTRFWSGGEEIVRRGEESYFAKRNTTSDAQGLWQVKGVPADLLHRIGIGASHSDYVGVSDYGRQSDSREQELRAGTYKVVLRRGSWVAGRVIDEIGDPIAGATVSAGKYNHQGTQETQTDARGAFGFRNLNPGEVQFSALAKGRKPEIRTVEVKPGMPEILFRLAKGQKVWGIVNSQSGKPIEGVRISLESKTGGVSDTYPLELKSGEDGRFEWDGAPDEPQNFCFLKVGYEAKRRQTLKLNEENVITLRTTRKIEGQVLDDATGQPVTKFRIGIGRDPGIGAFYADYPGMRDYADANGRFSLGASEEETRAVKVEADDYASQIKQLPESQDGMVQMELRLKPSAGLRGVLVTADGAPVAGATVAVSRGQPGAMLSLRNARLEDMGHQGNVAKTSAAGEFVLPSPPETGTVLAAAQEGFGSATIQQVRDSGRLVLQPYGRVEGTYTRGGQPVAGQEFTLSMREAGISFDFAEYKAATDENGRFFIARVPPGEAQVIRLVKTSENSWTHDYGADVTVVSGQAVQVAVGDNGAMLTGHIRFESPPAEGEKLSFGGSLSTAQPPLPGKMSAEEMRAYFQSPEGKARAKRMKSFAVTFAADGTWTADSVPPGTYNLHITASMAGSLPWEAPPVATGNAQVVVPEDATPQTQIPVDEVILKPSARAAK